MAHRVVPSVLHSASSCCDIISDSCTTSKLENRHSEILLTRLQTLFSFHPFLHAHVCVCLLVQCNSILHIDLHNHHQIGYTTISSLQGNSLLLPFTYPSSIPVSVPRQPLTSISMILLFGVCYRNGIV